MVALRLRSASSLSSFDDRRAGKEKAGARTGFFPACGWL
jgi:hypothetical protein